MKKTVCGLDVHKDSVFAVSCARTDVIFNKNLEF